MSDLNNEKLLALQSVQEDSHNERYNIPKEMIQVMDENMKNITCPQNIKEVDGYKTRKRTNKEYNIIWRTFKNDFASEFEAYMGYGIADIERIGINEFIDYMDWSSVEDIASYKTDRVKVIPCAHCRNHFTTFQIDLGLCDNCKEEYDLEKFGMVCGSSEEREAGSAAGLQIMFAYVDEFRNLYLKNRPVDELIKDAIEIDELSGPFTKDLLIDCVSGENKELFLSYCKEYSEKETVPLRVKHRLISIQNVLASDCEEEEKVSRIKAIF